MLPRHHALTSLPLQLEPRFSSNSAASFTGHLVFGQPGGDHRLGDLAGGELGKSGKDHVGFDFNRGVPRKIYLTDGKEGERAFVDKIIDKGETAVTDRGYQSHPLFDQWQASEKKIKKDGCLI